LVGGGGAGGRPAAPSKAKPSQARSPQRNRLPRHASPERALHCAELCCFLLQAMDRAHRLGQQRIVNVYRLLVRGTLEEQIMSLQQFKLDVAATLVNQDNVSLAAMDTSNLLELFTAQVGRLPALPCSSAGWGGPASRVQCRAGLSRLHILLCPSQVTPVLQLRSG
jgi:hypothetical protein